jgi:alpha-beta hydrolase superfamily lysophospholipase
MYPVPLAAGLFLWIFEKMDSRFIKTSKRFFVVLIFIYVLGGIVLYFIQDRILFHPQPLPKDHHFSFDQPFEEINIPFEKENLSIVKFKPNNTSKGIVLFYHGNMENVEHYKNYPDFFLRNGYELWMIDYPGFGKTTGKRSEKTIDEEALLMYDMASKAIGGDSILIYGKSIGTGIAAYVAANRNCRRLILETPYYSIPAMARHYFPIYPVNLLIKYCFPVHEYLNKAKASVTILHGTKDEIVPYQQSMLLKNEHPAIDLITIENGKHNNLSTFAVFQRKIDSLLAK